MEIQRLEDENRSLREMLGIAEEATAADEPGTHPVHEDKSPLLGPQRRQSSLTVEELEADAEKEEAEKERLEALADAAIEEEPLTLESLGGEQGRAPLDPDVLGFRAEAGGKLSPEQVFDETDGEPAA